MRTLCVGIFSNFVALIGFASACNAGATIDLLWAGGGTSATINSSSSAVLNIILTVDEISSGASVSIDYSDAASDLSVVGFTNNPNAAANILPIISLATVDDGSQIVAFNASALILKIGTGLAAGQSYLLGTVTFHRFASTPGTHTISAFDGSVFAEHGDSLPVSEIALGSASAPIPEPETMAFLALGLIGLAVTSRRHKN